MILQPQFVAVAGGLGVIIPPSIPFIMYAMATGESVSDLFLAGIVPGLMIGALLMFYAYYHCRRYGEDKEKIDAKVTELREKGFLKYFKRQYLGTDQSGDRIGLYLCRNCIPDRGGCYFRIYALFVSLFIFKSIKVKEIWGIYGGGHENVCTDFIYPCSVHCIFKSAYINAGSTDGECMDLGTFQQ